MLYPGATSDFGVNLMDKNSSELYRKQTFAAAAALDAIMVSTGPSDLCRQIVHADFVPDTVRGCQIYFLDNTSSLRLIAGYGVSPEPETELSAWDNSPLSEAIREKSIRTGEVTVDQGKMLVVAIPFISNGVPSGLVALVIDDLSLKIEFSEGMAQVFSKLGAFYLETLDFGNIGNGNGSKPLGIDDLTSRQLTILGHIDQGLVNLEIAKILMLSESTIRQETVKIYRALGVGNRQEATKKAKALGLLPKRSSLAS
jgi:DNA-binding CsgD family transcriptional regulator